MGIQGLHSSPYAGISVWCTQSHEIGVWTWRVANGDNRRLAAFLGWCMRSAKGVKMNSLFFLLTLNWAWKSDFFVIKDGVKIYIHFQTSTAQPLKFSNGYVIWPQLDWACDYLSMLGLTLVRVSKVKGDTADISISLTHWGRNKMTAIFRTTFFKFIFLNENVWIVIKISLKIFFLRVQLTMNQHWFR